MTGARGAVDPNLDGHAEQPAERERERREH